MAPGDWVKNQQKVHHDDDKYGPAKNIATTSNVVADKWYSRECDISLRDLITLRRHFSLSFRFCCAWLFLLLLLQPFFLVSAFVPHSLPLSFVCIFYDIYFCPALACVLKYNQYHLFRMHITNGAHFFVLVISQCLLCKLSLHENKFLLIFLFFLCFAFVTLFVEEKKKSSYNN